MSVSFAQKVYDRAPAWLQTLFVDAHAVRIQRERYGAKFRRALEELERTQYYGPDEIESYQNERVRRLVAHAYETVPYYRRVFDEHRLKPHDVRTTADLTKLPILTREDVARHGPELISRAVNPRRLVPGHTSGTTGSPLEFFWDIDTCVYNNAVDWRQKRWAGLDLGQPYAVLLGRPVVPRRRQRPPFWRMNHLHKQLWLSTFHLADRNLPHYVEKLRAYRPVALEGYPSTVYVLARWLLARGETLPLRAVLTSSETLHAAQRETLERAFSCKVFDFFGMAERVIFATECERHAGHHLNFEYGVTEVVDSGGQPVPRGTMGTLVGTSLRNFGMPFIRYRTSDVTAIKTADCPCGRKMPLVEDVTTKAEDFVVTPEGRVISPSILTHPFKPMHNIAMSQIIQEDLHSLRVLIVRRPGYGEEDSQRLVAAMQERVGAGLQIGLEFVEDIPRAESGKFRWVVSRVPLPF